MMFKGVQSVFEHLALVTNRCLDLWCLCLIGGISPIHMKGKVNLCFSGWGLLTVTNEKTQPMFPFINSHMLFL